MLEFLISPFPEISRYFLAYRSEGPDKLLASRCVRRRPSSSVRQHFTFQVLLHKPVGGLGLYRTGTSFRTSSNDLNVFDLPCPEYGSKT